MLPIALGTYPTAVQHLAALSAPGADLWVKRDDRTNAAYGGNKVRKLEIILARALAVGARRIVTVGAVGSHHVLATAYFGRQLGLDVEAVLFPQPRTGHAVEVLRAGLACGLRAFAARSMAAVPFMVGLRTVAGGRLVPPGGSNVDGASGYFHAARELAAQVRSGAMPEPDVCVVALGSGGTAAGLAAGFAFERMKTRVVGVCVVPLRRALGIVTTALARACARRFGERLSHARIRRCLTLDDRFLGRGYGHATQDGEAAMRSAHDRAGLLLDATYTAKAFACALWHVRARRAGCTLYWNTLSSAPMQPLLESAPPEGAVDPAVMALLLPDPSPRPSPRP
jgi:1-aminocyclopropane-1-carboxylate deaminase/D-cysteine desulfhydrase-like pyridoxal-dependent ACC family enzyme